MPSLGLSLGGWPVFDSQEGGERKILNLKVVNQRHRLLTTVGKPVQIHLPIVIALHLRAAFAVLFGSGDFPCRASSSIARSSLQYWQFGTIRRSKVRLVGSQIGRYNRLHFLQRFQHRKTRGEMLKLRVSRTRTFAMRFPENSYRPLTRSPCATTGAPRLPELRSGMPGKRYFFPYQWGAAFRPFLARFRIESEKRPRQNRLLRAHEQAAAARH